MEALHIILDLEQVGFKDGPYEVVEHKGPITIGAMPRGTASGNPAVMIGFELEDGTVLVAQTTLPLFVGAAKALTAKYGDI